MKIEIKMTDEELYNLNNTGKFHVEIDLELIKRNMTSKDIQKIRDEVCGCVPKTRTRKSAG